MDQLTPKLGQVEPHFPIFLKAHHVIMASPVQFILLTEMCKYFLSQPYTINLYDGFVGHDDVVAVIVPSD